MASPPRLKKTLALTALALVRVDVAPVAPAGVVVGAGALAARRAIVERARVGVEPHAGAPLVGEDPVRVDVAAEIEPVAAEVPAAPVIQVEAEAAQVLRRRVVAPLQPVVQRARVGAAEEAEIVDVEAGRFVAQARREADLRAGDLLDRNRPGVAAPARSASDPHRRGRHRAAGSCGPCFPAAARWTRRCRARCCRPSSRAGVALLKAPVPVHPARERACRQEVGLRVSRRALLVSMKPIADWSANSRRPRDDRVVRERFDRLRVRACRSERDRGSLLGRNGVHDAERELAGSARELGGAEDARLLRHAGVLIVGELRDSRAASGQCGADRTGRCTRRRCNRDRRRTCSPLRRRTAGARRRTSRTRSGSPPPDPLRPGRSQG